MLWISILTDVMWKSKNSFSDELLMATPPISAKYTIGIVLALTHFVTIDEDPLFC